MTYGNILIDTQFPPDLYFSHEKNTFERYQKPTVSPPGDWATASGGPDGCTLGSGKAGTCNIDTSTKTCGTGTGG